MGNLRVVVCEHTNKEVLQEKIDKDTWLCLHNDNEEQDKKEVEDFKNNN